VTLWEILTLARRRPFDALTDDQLVADRRRRHAAGPGSCSSVPGTSSESPGAVLERPGSCPREIYDLMVECWRVEAAQRPSFQEIHMFLQRKNCGYSPDYDEPTHCHQQTISDV